MDSIKINGHIKKMIGKKFGMLTVLSHKSRTEGYNCLCDCGNTTVARTYRLIRGLHNSCGCIHKRIGEDNIHYKGIGTLSRTHWCRIKCAASRRGIPFQISLKDAWELYLKQDKKCAYTQLPIAFGSIYRKIPTTASLDRIDSTKGYTKNNIQWLHQDVNYMKSDFSSDRFITICKIIAQNFAGVDIALQKK